MDQPVQPIQSVQKPVEQPVMMPKDLLDLDNGPTQPIYNNQQATSLL